MESSPKPNYLRFFGYIGLIIGAIALFAVLLSKNNRQTADTLESLAKLSPTPTIMHKTYLSKPPLTINPKKSYQAKLTTSKGPITIELFVKDTPETVNNFVFLAKSGFYDKTIFHRIIKDFMIQGGDPNGNGTGGPGYKFADEKITRDYKRGIVAMANSGPNTNGSQFFIMHKDNNLPKQYVIFGEVVDGLSTVDAIASTPVVAGMGGETSKPTEVVTIDHVEILEK